MFGLFRKRKKRVSLEEQLQNLQTLGIELDERFTMDGLQAQRMLLEVEPYIGLLLTLGSEALVDDKFVPLSTDIWHLDTECIDDAGDYTYIAERMRDLADGYLPLENIQDKFDVEAGEAWLAFTLDGKQHKWELPTDSDWVSPEVFSNFVNLLEERNCPGSFTYLDLRGQDCLIGFCLKSRLERLREVTGLKFEWLK